MRWGCAETKVMKRNFSSSKKYWMVSIYSLCMHMLIQMHWINVMESLCLKEVGGHWREKACALPPEIILSSKKAHLRALNTHDMAEGYHHYFKMNQGIKTQLSTIYEKVILFLTTKFYRKQFMREINYF